MVNKKQTKRYSVVLGTGGEYPVVLEVTTFNSLAEAIRHLNKILADNYNPKATTFTIRVDDVKSEDNLNE